MMMEDVACLVLVESSSVPYLNTEGGGDHGTGFSLKFYGFVRKFSQVVDEIDGGECPRFCEKNDFHIWCLDDMASRVSNPS